MDNKDIQWGKEVERMNHLDHFRKGDMVYIDPNIISPAYKSCELKARIVDIELVGKTEFYVFERLGNEDSDFPKRCQFNKHCIVRRWIERWEFKDNGTGLRAQITGQSGEYRPITVSLSEKQLTEFIHSLETKHKGSQPFKEIISMVHDTDYCFSHSRLKFLKFPEMTEVDEETEKKIIETIRSK